MKIMKNISQKTITLAAVTLLAVSGGATEPTTDGTNSWNWSAVNIDLDTRTMSRVAALADEELDSRSYTAAWSLAGELNTKRIIGTLFLIR
ncbi:MAG: hypothetical protein WC340_11170 [Kiritimatiellia bacterium]